MRFAVVPAFVLLAGCGSAPEAPADGSAPVAASGPVGSVTLVFSGRGEGEIEPCG